MPQKIYQFRANNSEIKPYTSGLGKISKDFTVSNIKKQDQMGTCTIFNVDYFTIDNNDIINVHKYLMKRHNIKY